MALTNVKFYNDVKLHLVKQDETKNGTPRVSFCWLYLDDDGNHHYLWNSVIYSGDYSPEVFQRTMQDMLPEGTPVPQMPTAQDAAAYAQAMKDKVNSVKLYAKEGTNAKGYRQVYVNRSKR